MRATEDEYSSLIEPMIEEFFKIKSGRVVNERLRLEYEKVNKTFKARSEAGKKGGRPQSIDKQGKDKKAGFDFDKGELKQPEPEPEPYKEYLKKPISQRSQYNKVGEPIFDQFLNVIWVHRWKDGDNRKEAYFAYCKLTDQDKALLADAMTMAKKEMFGKENQFRKSMAAWINASGWESFSQSPVQNENGMTDEQWNEWVKAFYNNGTWHPDLGAEPDKPGCRAPTEILDRWKK